MDDLIKENLEDYLSGTLAGERRRRWDAYLSRDPKVAEQVALLEASAGLLHELRAPDTAVSESPDFYARVMARVEDQRSAPFWLYFLQPAFVRQLAFACLMWFALLGSYAVMSSGSDRTPHFAEEMLVSHPPEYQVRLGSDLDQNRRSMMAVLMRTSR